MIHTNRLWMLLPTMLILISVSISISIPSKKRLDVIQESGILTVATRMNGVGCYLHQDQPAGLECDLLQAYANVLGLKIDFQKAASINEVLTMVRNGKVDIAASDLTHTSSREKNLVFSSTLFETREVIVQRTKPALINFEELRGKVLTIHTDSAYLEEITTFAKSKNIPLRFPTNPDNSLAITITPASSKISVLELIDAVSTGEIDFTIADEHIVNGSNGYNQNLDTSFVFGVNRRIAFALDKNSDSSLLNSLNNWLEGDEAQSIIKSHLTRLRFRKESGRDLYVPPKGSLSPWDKLFKRFETEPFDWVWLAAQSSAESNFKSDAVSRAGAQGLMQLMPETAKEMGVIDSFNPAQNIKGGVKYTVKQYERWRHLPVQDAMAFTFASYNAGAGHVLDAQRLAKQAGENPNQWFSTNRSKGVEDYILLLQKADFYNNPIVRYGYCRGAETRLYVRKIFTQEKKYRTRLRSINTSKKSPQNAEQSLLVTH
ncbi:transglycosylase SLT domain-containing protein [Microbulbifer sp. JMSA004]|uniref:transglycosylase SLT domain-containing protein n=1 Tax=Microbulbifer sp. JMSA004 TaxID=3243370 RepID=UPI004039F42D